MILYSAKDSPNLTIAGWIEASLPFFNSWAVMEEVGEAVETVIWGKWANKETFLSGLRLAEGCDRFAVF